AYQALASPESRLAYDEQLHRARAADAAERAQRPHADVAPVAPAEPELTLRLVPGAPSIGRLAEPTRFYLLGELLPIHATAQAWSAPLNLAVLLDRSSSMRGPKIFEA